MIHQLVPLTEDVVHVDVLRMTCIGHTVIAHEHNVDDIGQIAGDQGLMQVFGEYVDLSQNALQEKTQVMDAAYEPDY